MKSRSFDKEGNFGFGIREHIDLPGIKYDPKLGILGFDVLVTLKKIGYRVKVRKIKKKRVGKKQRVTKEEAIEFVKGLGVELEWVKQKKLKNSLNEKRDAQCAELTRDWLVNIN